MVLSTDITTALGTGWNAVVIAKPRMFNGGLRKSAVNPATLLVEVLPDPVVNPRKIGGALTPVKQFFNITIIAVTRAELDKYIGEIRRILHASTPTGGGWYTMVGQPMYSERQKVVKATLNCVENKMITSSTWS